MKLTKTAAAVTLSLGLGLASSANAAIDLDFGTVAVGSQFNGLVNVLGAFQDTFRFSVATPLISSGSITNVKLTGFYDIADLSYSLFTQAGTPIIENIGAGITTGGPLAVGNYYFTVTGTGTGIGGAGAYAYAVGTAPIPEPEAYAMMLAGLGIVGAMARRRINKG
ncbi:MAG TPA: FxDxF family PEP-CTERM protein [Rhodocyclaceae bacterium]|nr:FxDxF family PEP-CTERM protein [Rhodocyclaceae bacterium]